MVYLLENAFCTSIYAKGRIYADKDVTDHDPFGRKSDRNSLIVAHYSDGVAVSTLAARYGLSKQRIHQIIQRGR